MIIAGPLKSGKSTCLNNIFGLNLRTEGWTYTHKESSKNVEKHGVSLNVIDTPGFLHNDYSMIIKDMRAHGKDIILVHTLSSSLDIKAGYHSIIENINSSWGPTIWDRSVFLLTFSDKVFHEMGQQQYLDHLKVKTKELQCIFESISVTKPVQLFFEYTSRDQFKKEKLDGIVAIPVANSQDFPTEKLFPLQHWSHGYKWTDLAFEEILKLLSDSRSKCLIL